MIIDALSELSKLQSICVIKESRKNIVKRGIEKCTILSTDNDVQSIVFNLLKIPFCDKDEILKFQHNVYHSLMKIEVSCIDKELTALNALAAKQRRLLKSITLDSVFKMCSGFLESKKASDTIEIGKDNEILWKKAVNDNVDRKLSVEKWLKTISSINAKCQYDDNLLHTNTTSLSVSPTEHMDITPEIGELQKSVDAFVANNLDIFVNTPADIFETTPSSDVRVNDEPEKVNDVRATGVDSCTFSDEDASNVVSSGPLDLSMPNQEGRNFFRERFLFRVDTKNDEFTGDEAINLATRSSATTKFVDKPAAVNPPRESTVMADVRRSCRRSNDRERGGFSVKSEHVNDLRRNRKSGPQSNDRFRFRQHRNSSVYDGTLRNRFNDRIYRDAPSRFSRNRFDEGDSRGRYRSENSRGSKQDDYSIGDNVRF